MIEVDGRQIEVIDVHVHPPRGEPWGEYSSIEEELIGRMDEAGVDRIVLLPIDADGQDVERNKDRFYRYEQVYRFLMREELEPAIQRTIEWLNGMSTTEERVKEMVDQYPDRFIGFGSINPNRGPDYVAEKLQKIKDYGLRGIKLLPTIQFFNPNEERMDQIYEFAAREGLVLLMHTGCDPGLWEYVGVCQDANPLHLDRVAERYPELTLIGAHMGCYSARKPGIWFKEMMSVASKHPNVYVDTAALGGPEVYLDVGVQWIGIDKIIYGTDFPSLEFYANRESGMKPCLDRFSQVNLSPEEKEKMFSGNIKRLLGI